MCSILSWMLVLYSSLAFWCTWTIQSTWYKTLLGRRAHNIYNTTSRVLSNLIQFDTEGTFDMETYLRLPRLEISLTEHDCKRYNFWCVLEVIFQTGIQPTAEKLWQNQWKTQLWLDTIQRHQVYFRKSKNFSLYRLF